jgi:hypothetical protein
MDAGLGDQGLGLHRAWVRSERQQYQRLGCTMQNTHAYQTPDLSGRDTPVRGWRLVRAITMFREVPAQLRLVFGKFNAVRS